MSNEIFDSDLDTDLAKAEEKVAEKVKKISLNS